MKTCTLIGFLMTFCAIACNDDGVGKTKNFTPEVVDYEFFIEGVIDEKLIRYRQINYESTNVSNKYFIDYKETWLQAYQDSVSPDPGYWELRIHDVDIRNTQLPYTLKEGEGNIAWDDPRIDAIIENNTNCQGIDSDCAFIISSDGSNFTLTSNQDSILEGTFSGRAYIMGIDFAPYSDSTLYHDVTNGKFRIKYRVE